MRTFGKGKLFCSSLKEFENPATIAAGAVLERKLQGKQRAGEIDFETYSLRLISNRLIARMIKTRTWKSVPRFDTDAEGFCGTFLPWKNNQKPKTTIIWLSQPNVSLSKTLFMKPSRYCSNNLSNPLFICLMIGVKNHRETQSCVTEEQIN